MTPRGEAAALYHAASPRPAAGCGISARADPSASTWRGRAGPAPASLPRPGSRRRPPRWDPRGPPAGGLRLLGRGNGGFRRVEASLEPVAHLGQVAPPREQPAGRFAIDAVRLDRARERPLGPTVDQREDPAVVLERGDVALRQVAPHQRAGGPDLEEERVAGPRRASPSRRRAARSRRRAAAAPGARCAPRLRARPRPARRPRGPGRPRPPARAGRAGARARRRSPPRRAGRGPTAGRSGSRPRPRPAATTRARGRRARRRRAARRVPAVAGGVSAGGPRRNG